MNLRTNLHHSC